jgi:hypothetical protein
MFEEELAKNGVQSRMPPLRAKVTAAE